MRNRDIYIRDPRESQTDGYHIVSIIRWDDGLLEI
jgi:hypothetical protein